MVKVHANLSWLACVVGLLCVFAVSGCGLLGIDLTPESTRASVQFYTVPFVCESDASGQLVESTSVILHNPESGQAEIYRRAVLVVLETDPAPAGVVWSRDVLRPGLAVRLDCDAFARILTNDPGATFNNQFEAGERVDGFLTLGIQSDSEISRLDAVVQHGRVDALGATSIANEPIEPTAIQVAKWPPEIG